MGLTYDSGDSDTMVAALTRNLAAARSAVDQTHGACHHLLSSLETGQLSGQGYSAVHLMFSQGIVPGLAGTRVQLDGLERDLEKYVWEDSKVKRFGVLEEDALEAQLEATKAQRGATERLIEVNRSAEDALGGLPLVGDTLRDANRRLELVLHQLERDVNELGDRLQALRAFDAATRSLFANGLVETESGRRSARPHANPGPAGIIIQPTSLVVPGPGATVQQIAQWLITGSYGIGALTAACGGAAVMAAIALITIGGVGSGSTSGSRFYTPEEQLRRSSIRWYYLTHDPDGSLKQRIGPAPTQLGKYLSEEASFDEVEKILEEKTRPGRTHPHREVDTPAELDELAEEISQGGKAVDGPASYKGTWVELPGGTRIGRRTDSTSGGPTVDIQPPSGRPIKVHLPKGWGK